LQVQLQEQQSSKGLKRKACHPHEKKELT